MRALVTGASRGIGRAVAKRLHQQGARQVLSARTLDALSGVLAEVPGSTPLAADLSDSRAAADLVDQAAAALGGLDVLVHCAGIVRYAGVLEATAAELQEQLALHCVSAFVMTQAAARQMRSAGRGGAIVHLASTLGLRPAPNTATYAASKAALISLTKSFAHELGPANIRVNAIAPGLVDTEMIRVVRSADRDQLTPQQTQQRIADQLEQLRRQHPIGRLGKPEDIAEAVAYLLNAPYITGTTLTIDGGLKLNS